MAVSHSTSPSADDAKIPELAGIALKQAYARALILDGKVVTADRGCLVEVRADGGRRELGKLPGHIRVTPGVTLVRKTAR